MEGVDDFQAPEGADLSTYQGMMATQEEKRSTISKSAEAEKLKSEQYERAADELLVTGPSHDTSDRFSREHLSQDMPKWENSDEYKRARVGKVGMAAGFSLLVASLVGPLFMRTGATGAMYALNAALKGWHEGNREKWQEARDEYDKHLSYIQHQNDKMMREYNSIRNEEDKDTNNKIQRLMVFFKQHDMHFKNDVMTLDKIDKNMLSIKKAMERIPKNSQTQAMKTWNDMANTSGDAKAWKADPAHNFEKMFKAGELSNRPSKVAKPSLKDEMAAVAGGVSSNGTPTAFDKLAEDAGI